VEDALEGTGKWGVRATPWGQEEPPAAVAARGAGEPLRCNRCGAAQTNMPKLKAHLAGCKAPPPPCVSVEAGRRGRGGGGQQPVAEAEAGGSGAGAL
jgi:hypothetical protein